MYLVCVHPCMSIRSKWFLLLCPDPFLVPPVSAHIKCLQLYNAQYCNTMHISQIHISCPTSTCSNKMSPTVQCCAPNWLYIFSYGGSFTLHSHQSLGGSVVVWTSVALRFVSLFNFGMNSVCLSICPILQLCIFVEYSLVCICILFFPFQRTYMKFVGICC